MGEVAFRGYAEFSDAGVFVAILWFTLRGPPYPYRMVITDTAVRIEGRRVPRAILPSRSCEIDELVCARLRGTLVILYLSNDKWWTLSTVTKGKKIVRELKSRGVTITQDA